MTTLRDLNKPPAIEGRIESIVVRGPPRDPARLVDATVALAGIGHGGMTARVLGTGAIRVGDVVEAEA